MPAVPLSRSSVGVSLTAARPMTTVLVTVPAVVATPPMLLPRSLTFIVRVRLTALVLLSLLSCAPVYLRLARVALMSVTVPRRVMADESLTLANRLALPESVTCSRPVGMLKAASTVPLRASTSAMLIALPPLKLNWTSSVAETEAGTTAVGGSFAGSIELMTTVVLTVCTSEPPLAEPNPALVRSFSVTVIVSDVSGLSPGTYLTVFNAVCNWARVPLKLSVLVPSPQLPAPRSAACVPVTLVTPVVSNTKAPCATLRLTCPWFVPSKRDRSISPRVKIEPSASCVFSLADPPTLMVGVLFEIVGASLSAVTVKETVSVAVEKAVMPPLVAVSTPVAPLLPLVWSQARTVSAVACTPL